MKLLTKAQRTRLIKAGERAGITGETSNRAIAKFFDPSGRYTFYAFDAEERDGDLIIFGYAVSPLAADCDEWGSVSLNELAATRGQLGLGMERDLYFAGVTSEEINSGARP